MSDILKRLSVGFRRAVVVIAGEEIHLRSLSAAGHADLFDARDESDVRRNARLLSLCIVDANDHRMFSAEQLLDLPPERFRELLDGVAPILATPEPGEPASGN